MNLVIDNLDSTTGWSESGGSTSVYGLNDHGQYIAGGLSKSLIFNFSGLDSYVEKTYDDVDISNYEELVVSVWSQQKKGTDFKQVSDFSYKIEIGTGNIYYLPVWRTFHHIVIDVSSISTLDMIKITALHDDSDYLVMSYMVVAKDEVPLDLFDGIKSGMETFRDTLDTFLLGTMSGSANDETLTLTNFNFIDDYAVVLIDDGNNDETHQVRRNKEGVYFMTDLYDGSALINSYTNASVYLFFPIENGGRDTLEAIIPGITIWGFEPENLKRESELQSIYDTFTDLGASERQEGIYFRHPILLDCEARQYEIMAHLTKIVRQFIGRKVVYINGRKFHLEFSGAPVLQEPTEAFDIIPKIQYPAVLELKEDVWQRASLVKTTTINTSVTIQ
jgi:hypothetical protein